MVPTLKNFVGGERVTPRSTETIPLHNPATGEVLAQVPLSDDSDVAQAVQAAKKAFHTWSKTPVPQRARVLFKYHQLLIDNWEALAALITQENGKSYADAYGEVQRGIECVEFAAGAPSLMMGKQLPDIATGVESGMYHYPLGVVGGIPPFNFPMMVPSWMFPMAIACGNTFVMKPSEKTPLTTMRLAELLQEAGLPAGVFNLVHGGKAAVDGILHHPDIAAISFVGSTPVGQYVYQTGTSQGKRVQSLMGAKNHTIIMPDADIEYAVNQVINGAFGSAGQRCMSAAVLVLVGDVAEPFLARLKEATDKLTIGNGMNKDTFLGPVIDQAAKERTLAFITEGEKEGAVLYRDGRKDKLPTEGCFVGPTIIDHVKPTMGVWQEEIFAPVLVVSRVDTLTEAIDLANQSSFANGACIYTDSGRAVRQFRETIDAGMLGVNLAVPAPMAFFPFSGWKGSFVGDLHANGPDGVAFYTRKKMLTSKW